MAATTLPDGEVRERVARVEGLLGTIESDEKALTALGAVVDLYGEGLRRLVGAGLPEGALEDELVVHLLVLHDLHPDSVETRVGRALEEVQPYLRSHGGGVELVDVTDGVVHLRLQGTCNGCPSSTATMKLAIEEAVGRAAPEVERVEAEGVAKPAPSPLLQLSVVHRDDGTTWRVAGGLPDLNGGGGAVRKVGQTPILFLGLDGDLFAYRPACACCGASLSGEMLVGGELVCASCGNHFDVRRAGRCLDSPQTSLTPVPLLVDPGGLVKVALA